MLKNFQNENGNDFDSLSYNSLELQSLIDKKETFLFFLWPCTVVHVIDPESPFWELSKKKLETTNFELFIFVEGTIESTGMTTQFRTSYTSDEIIWGHKPAPLTRRINKNGVHEVDYGSFHSTCQVKFFSFD